MPAASFQPGNAVTTGADVNHDAFDNSTVHNETVFVVPLFLSPVPFYGTIIIGAFCILVLICCVVCTCVNIFGGRKKKGKKERKRLSLPRASIFVGAEKVQPDMEDLVDKDDKDDHICGRLHYSLEFSVGNATLTVTVIECQQLAAMDINGSSDPYVKVRLLPLKKPVFYTKTKQKTLDPLFNETFIFEDVQSTEVVKRTLAFHVFDHDVIGGDDLIGHVTVPLCDVDLSKQIHEAWVDLQKPGDENDEQPLGDICLSLRYVPARGLLTVVVLEAKNLPCNEQGDDQDTFVKLSIIKDGKKIKIKKTGVRKKSSNPYFNETFTFEVPFALIKTIILRVSIAVPKLAGFGGKSIGTIELSSLFGGSHWQDMLSNPRHPVARWHRLLRYGDYEQSNRHEGQEQGTEST